MSKGGIDYGLQGISMSELRGVIVGEFLNARKLGNRPGAIMAWGPPGAGKTMITLAAARKISQTLGVHCDVFDNSTSCLEPTDVAGVPTPVEVDGVQRYTSYLPPRWAYLCSEEYEEDMRREDPDFVAPPAILFFDDIVAAHFQTQTAFFKGVDEGRWGDLRQRDNVLVVACGNRVEDNAGANDMPTPLANRFLHVYAHPTVDGWLDHAQVSKFHPFVIAYIRTNQGDLSEFDESVANRADKAFASPRTWERVSKFLQGGEIDRKTNSVFGKLIMGLIGRGTGTKFLAFLQNTVAVIPPETICKNPEGAEIPKNLDALHATITSLEKYVTEHPDEWRAAVKYACRKDMLADTGLMLATTVSGVIMDMTPDDRRACIDDDVFSLLFDTYEDSLDIAI
jgi:hypothetical protein